MFPNDRVTQKDTGNKESAFEMGLKMNSDVKRMRKCKR